MVQLIAVIGSGTMGRGIAGVAVASGYDTVLYDVDASSLTASKRSIQELLTKRVSKGKLSEADSQNAMARLQTIGDLEPAVNQADLVIEAIPEDFDLKRELFAQIDLFCPESAILASNTSSISISRLAESVERPECFVGLHFFNPPHVMKLLEIVAGARTSKSTIDQVRTVGERMEKQPIVVRDSPGFATSRLGVALGLEAIRMLEEGVAAPEDIDLAMELGYNHPMGPLRLTDLIGLDVRLNIAEYLASTLGRRYEPPALLRQKVAEGKLGKKSGEGFYRW